MTFATNVPAPHSGPSVRRSASGFTLIELMVVVGIIVLLIGILLPAVSLAYKKAIITRQKADLQSIATALDQYKADFDGNYPSVDADNTGAAVLGKALFGMGDAAHYYRGSVSPDDIGNASYNPGTNPVADNTLQNGGTGLTIPASYNSGTTYSLGQVVVDGSAPTFTQYLQGTGLGLYVSLQNNNTGNSLTTSPNLWWAPFNPFDGKDGPGFRKRLNTLADNNGPHAASGQVYGPYLRTENYHFSGFMILDRYNSPILYFPTQTKSSVSNANGLVALRTVPNVKPWLSVYHDLAYFSRTVTEMQDADFTGYARIAILLGDYNVNGKIDASEPALEPANFVLWSAGPDTTFGPAGANNPGSTTAGDFDKSGANVDQNRRTAAACDDITTFR